MLLDRCDTSAALRLSHPPFDSPENRESDPGVVPETPVLSRKRRHNLFGRADLAYIYRRAKDLIIQHKLLRITRYEEQDGIRQLTICNLWRIERLPDASIRTLNFNLVTTSWEEVRSTNDWYQWPEMPFYPIEQTKSLGWWKDIIKGAIWKALIAAGYSGELKKKKGMKPGQMAYFLLNQYVGGTVYLDKFDAYGYPLTKETPGRLDPETMKAGARALRAAFFQHILDHEVLSAVLAINYRECGFRRYLQFARYRSGLLKVAAEHRNLLPLLPGINPDQWSRNDLFSRKLWVKDGRKSTAIDRYPVQPYPIQARKSGRLITDCDSILGPYVGSFDSAAVWRWLSKASSLIVRAWYMNHTSQFGYHSANYVIANMALANINAKAPVCAYVKLICNSYYLRDKDYAVSSQIQQLYRLYFAHAANLWKENGYAVVREWVKDVDQKSIIHDMLDWLEAEGFAQGFPNKRATWTSLLRRSDDWHRRIAIDCMEHELNGKTLEWVSLLPETVIDDIAFAPLTNSRALAVEGYELKHCIGNYVDMCNKGRYRAYSVLEPDGSRSTLGFSVQSRTATLDQHRGKHNGPISPAAKEAGRLFVEAYQQALREKKGGWQHG